MRVFLTKAAEELGDKHPDSDQIHLPSCYTQKDLYFEFQVSVGKEESVSLGTFYRIWSEDFPDLKVAVVNKFSKCNYCWKVKQLLNRHRSSQSIRQELRKRREKHNQYQRYL